MAVSYADLVNTTVRRRLCPYHNTQQRWENRQGYYIHHDNYRFSNAFSPFMVAAKGNHRWPNGEPKLSSRNHHSLHQDLHRTAKSSNSSQAIRSPWSDSGVQCCVNNIPTTASRRGSDYRNALNLISPIQVTYPHPVPYNAHLRPARGDLVCTRLWTPLFLLAAAQRDSAYCTV